MVLPLIIVVVVSLMVSAFFSGMEIAFLSSNKLKLEIEKKQSRVFNFVAGVFSRHAGQYITTILVGNNIALVVYSMFMSRLIQHWLGVTPSGELSGFSFVIETVVSTVIIIYTAEFVPKAVVRLNPNFYYRTFAVPVYLFYLLFYPIAKIVTFIVTLLLRLFGLPLNVHQSLGGFDRVDLEHLLDEASESEQECENEKEIKLFQNALDFSDLLVRDCMVPRVDIEAIDRNCSVEEARQRFVDTQFSRLLVYDGNIDHVIGFIHNKSLLQYPQTILDVLKKVEYVPESMPTRRLLSIFIKKHHSVAVVIDEFGGTAGMVTIEDILEEIFGEIEDEHDSQELVEKKINDREFLFSGRLEIEAINEKYGIGLPESDDYDTLAGYVISVYQGIPEAGETIMTDRMRIRILRTDASKIELVRITLI